MTPRKARGVAHSETPSLLEAPGGDQAHGNSHYREHGEEGPEWIKASDRMPDPRVTRCVVLWVPKKPHCVVGVVEGLELSPAEDGGAGDTLLMGSYFLFPTMGKGNEPLYWYPIPTPPGWTPPAEVRR